MVSDSVDESDESDEVPMIVGRGRQLNFLDDGNGESSRVGEKDSKEKRAHQSSSRARKSSSESGDLLAEMQKNKLLSTLLARADSTEDRLKKIEEGRGESTSSTPTSRRCSRKRSVPPEVRASIQLAS